MRASGMRNSPCLPLAALLIMLLCFLLYQFYGPPQRGDTRVIIKSLSTYQSQKQEMVRVLRKATMPDRTVIITMVNESWASPGSMLDVFLQGFKSGKGTRRLLNHLVIITMDHEAYEYCRALHPYCIHPSTFAHFFATKRQSTTNSKQSAFSWRRNNVLLDILDLGYNIIFTGADVLWLRSPLSKFNPTNELSISCDFSTDGQGGGIFFLKSNAVAFEFFKYWKVVTVLYPKSQAEEPMCATITQYQETVNFYGFRVNYVDTTYLSGFCQLNKDTLREAYTIHANCCDDLTSKVHDLRIVLDDWINSRKYVTRNNVSDNMTLMRALKCPAWKST